MNAKSLSPRIKSVKKSQIVLQKLNSLIKVSPPKPNDSTLSINFPDSMISLTNSQLGSHLSSSKISLKLSSPCSQTSLNYSAAHKLQEISKHFSKKNASSPSQRKILGEQLLPLPAEQVISTFNALLSKYELSELFDYREVYYLGLKSNKIQPNIKLRNMGFDNKETDYTLIKGDHIAYQYEILEVLGSGSFAQVCKCRDHKHKKDVAIKVIKSHRRFHDQGQVELKVLAYLKKYGRETSVFVNMLDHFIFRGHLCIVFELLSFTLYDLLRANNFRGFSTTLVRRFTAQILAGLLFLRSSHIIHCDLKPENIILISPQESSIKIIDFGSSCFDDERVYYYIQSKRKIILKIYTELLK